MTREIVENGLTFSCISDLEVSRAQTLLEKEPGTIAWLTETLKEGDVFFDVGANIGTFTLYAARIVGPEGRVYAFEPHPANATALARNIIANNFQDRVQIVTAPLHSNCGTREFLWADSRSGSTGSQLGHCNTEAGPVFNPELTQICEAVTLDYLVESGLLRWPKAVKIDVDGNELAILHGGKRLLATCAVSVESHPKDRKRLLDFMKALGQDHLSCNLTMSNTKRVQEQGANADYLIQNFIFG